MPMIPWRRGASKRRGLDAARALWWQPATFAQTSYPLEAFASTFVELPQKAWCVLYAARYCHVGFIVLFALGTI
ncbi:hypothetical protein EJ04DRAFT_508816 [Polyplosphaeria fusca]|uniref:Uncharacterized protein n=1 Tax=Polyplosphaeria fusca TaxID=682080 RepID=A0A9P4R9A2_9PLEO|nr:hypothetical protein EJ04DRAFT_508816 [Polyplosphaeria fusca]